MTRLVAKVKIRGLAAAKSVIPVDEISEGVVDEEVMLSQAQPEEIDRHVESYRSGESELIPWEVVKEHIRRK